MRARSSAHRSHTVAVSHRSQVNPAAVGMMGMSAGGAVTATLSARWDEALYAKIDDADDLHAQPDFCVFMYPSSTDVTHLHAVDAAVCAPPPPPRGSSKARAPAAAR